MVTFTLGGGGRGKGGEEGGRAPVDTYEAVIHEAADYVFLI